MKEVQIKARDSKTNKEAVASYQLGESTSESIQLFGENVVNGLFEDALIIRLQALMRRCLAKDMTAEQIQQQVSAYKPGAPAPRAATGMSVVKAFLKKFSEASAEEKAKLLAEIKELAKGA